MLPTFWRQARTHTLHSCTCDTSSARTLRQAQIWGCSRSLWRSLHHHIMHHGVLTRLLAWFEDGGMVPRWRTCQNGGMLRLRWRPTCTWPSGPTGPGRKTHALRSCSKSPGAAGPGGLCAPRLPAAGRFEGTCKWRPPPAHRTPGSRMRAGPGAWHEAAGFALGSQLAGVLASFPFPTGKTGCIMCVWGVSMCR